jgi:hypothetical protein
MTDLDTKQTKQPPAYNVSYWVKADMLARMH